MPVDPAVAVAITCASFIVAGSLLYVSNIVRRCSAHVCREALNCEPEFLKSVRDWLAGRDIVVGTHRSLKKAIREVSTARWSNIGLFLIVVTVSTWTAFETFGLGVGFVVQVLATSLALVLAVIAQEKSIEGAAEERLLAEAFPTETDEEEQGPGSEGDKVLEEIEDAVPPKPSEKAATVFKRARSLWHTFFGISVNRLRRKLQATNSNRAVLHRLFVEYIMWRTHTKELRRQLDQSWKEGLREIVTPLQAWANTVRDGRLQSLQKWLDDKQILVAATVGRIGFGENEVQIRKLGLFDEVLDEIEFSPHTEEGCRRTERVADAVDEVGLTKVFRLPTKGTLVDDEGSEAYGAFEAKVVESYSGGAVLVLQVDSAEFESTLGFLRGQGGPPRLSYPPISKRVTNPRRKLSRKERKRKARQAEGSEGLEASSPPRDKGELDGILSEEGPRKSRLSIIRFEEVRKGRSCFYRVVVRQTDRA